MSEVKKGKTLIIPKVDGVLAFIIMIPVFCFHIILFVDFCRIVVRFSGFTRLVFLIAGDFFPIIFGLVLTILCFFSKKAKILKKLSAILLIVVYIIDVALLLFNKEYWGLSSKYFLYTMIILTAMSFFALLLYLRAAKLYLSNSDSNTGNGGTTPVGTDVNAVG